MNFSYVGPDVSVGKNCIINNYASIEHESIIGDHCHISTGVRINGNCSVGSGTFIGSGTILDNDIKIGNNCVVGSGLSIKKNIPARKKSYCARSGGIKGKNSKLSANYWSRRAWNC